ncbi:hypothetical protein [uncultured Mediterranean phage uvDeep-CGR2-AD3-C191]|nr:hypothetical protein [uncultured Mediterranean phage uvDeep-CGR2-AD3-C191]
MEMQLFLLGHVILLGICFCTAMVSGYGSFIIEQVSGMTGLEALADKEVLGNTLIYFILLEIIYWVLHFTLI